MISPMLFVIVMDTVTRSAKEGLPWETLYADNLVLLTYNERQSQKKIEDWRKCLSSKGFKVNTLKTKVMLSTHTGEPYMTGKFPCGVVALK